MNRSQVDSDIEGPKVPLAVPCVVACGLFMAQLDSTIIATSIPQMALSLGVEPLHLNLAITSYLITLAVFIPISGWCADRFGARRVFCTALLLFSLGSILCGLSVNFYMLIISRIIQGLGGAIMTPVGRLILIRTYPKKQLVTAMSYVAIPALVGPAIGPVLGGLLTTYFSWRWIFYINVPVGIFGVLAACRYIEHDLPMDKLPRFDWCGFLLVGSGLGIFAIATDTIGRGLVSAYLTLAMYLTAVFLLWIYVRHARRFDSPVLDLKLLKIPTFRVAALAGSVNRLAIGAVPFMLPLMLQLGFGLDPLHSGLLTFIISIGAMMNKVVVSRLLRRFGFRNLLLHNGVVFAGMVCGLAFFRGDTPHLAIWLYLLGFGFVRSVQMTSINLLGYSDLSYSIMSKGTSAASVLQQISLSFGVAIAASLLAASVGNSNLITAQDFAPAFLVIGLLALCGTIGFRRLKMDAGSHVSGHLA